MKCGEVIYTTLAEARRDGWKEGEVMWARGYISRKTNVENQPVLAAGGARKGRLYYEAPAWKSTNYYYRVYQERR